MAEEFTEEGLNNPEQTLNNRIEAALDARERAGTPWAANYWDIVLADLLRKANRIGAENHWYN